MGTKIKVFCQNRNKKRKVNLARTEKTAEKVLGSFKKNLAVVNVVFVSNQKIRALNRKYFGLDRATDVISFPSGDGFPEESGFMGDIVISSDKAAQNAKAYGVTFEEEMSLYVIHGILHLLGFEDKTKKGRAAMRSMEDECLKKTG